jgi:Uma2 family endonuclease
MSTATEKAGQLYPGQRLTRDEFLRRWEAMPELKYAELIGGIVYMPSPVSIHHGKADNRVATWVGTYSAFTPVCESATSATWLMLQDAPQPDETLRLLTEFGGHSRHDGNYWAGAPEFAAEVSRSTADYDLRQKLDLYQSAGVDEYLVMLLETREIRWHRLVSGVYELMSPAADGIFRSRVFPGLWLQPGALLDGDMAAVLATLQQGLQSAEHGEFIERCKLRRSGT